MNCLIKFSTPQLELLRRGKVRDNFRIDDKTRMIVVSDRISSFDKVLKSAIPDKGRVLTGIANYWFERTRGIVDNHLIRAVDPNVTLVREATPIPIEMIVRGYLAGSMWRQYRKGKRRFSGVVVPDGLNQYDRLPDLILTPTTKAESDREITPGEIVARGLADKQIYEQMAHLSLQLFRDGITHLAERNLTLVDSKYEFGLLDGNLILIDEIHTPDSSRFWIADEYGRDHHNVVEMDKEYVRAWLLENMSHGCFPDTLPPAVIEETSRRYRDLFHAVTGRILAEEEDDVCTRIYRNLVREGIIREGYIAIVMGSTRDAEFAEQIRAAVEDYEIAVDMRVMSAHKNPEDVVRLAEVYNCSIEPGAAIAVAGLSNGLGGALGANLNIPVFNCPPFQTPTDMLININSSLMLPSRVPAATILDPRSAAGAALRSLNLQRLRKIFRDEIADVKQGLREADRKCRER